jgi:nicotinate-nucleotide adenylyltransferase
VGHLAVLKALAHDARFAEVWLVPVFDHAFGKNLMNYEDRVKMTQLLAQDAGTNNVVVSTAERDLGKRPSYTVDLIEYLQKKNPDHRYTLVVGSDARADLPKWHRIEDLKKIVDFEFVPRQGYEASPYPEVSSSQIRKMLARDEDISGLTTAKIAHYLETITKTP